MLSSNRHKSVMTVCNLVKKDFARVAQVLNSPDGFVFKGLLQELINSIRILL